MTKTLLKQVDGVVMAIRHLSNSMMYIGVVIICIISVVSFYGIVQRGLGTPASWPLELNELLQVALAFLSAAYVLNAGKHVSMELLMTVLGESKIRILRIIVNIVGSIVAGLLAYATAPGAMSSMAVHEATIVTSLPIAPFKFCVTIGFTILGLQFAGHAWESFRKSSWSMPESNTNDHPV